MKVKEAVSHPPHQARPAPADDVEDPVPGPGLAPGHHAGQRPVPEAGLRCVPGPRGQEPGPRAPRGDQHHLQLAPDRVLHRDQDLDMLQSDVTVTGESQLIHFVIINVSRETSARYSAMIYALYSA